MEKWILTYKIWNKTVARWQIRGVVVKATKWDVWQTCGLGDEGSILEGRRENVACNDVSRDINEDATKDIGDDKTRGKGVEAAEPKQAPGE